MSEIQAPVFKHIISNTPKPVMDAFEYILFQDVLDVSVLFVVGAPHTGKWVFSQMISVIMGVSTLLDLDPWHIPLTSQTTATLNSHIAEWTPKAKLVQFRNCKDFKFDLDELHQLVNHDIKTIVVYANSLKNTVVHDASLLGKIAVVEMKNVIPEEEMDDSIYARLTNEKQDILKYLKDEYKPEYHIPQTAFANAKKGIKLVTPETAV